MIFSKAESSSLLFCCVLILTEAIYKNIIWIYTASQTAAKSGTAKKAV